MLLYEGLKAMYLENCTPIFNTNDKYSHIRVLVNSAKQNVLLFFVIWIAVLFLHEVGISHP